MAAFSSERFLFGLERAVSFACSVGVVGFLTYSWRRTRATFGVLDIGACAFGQLFEEKSTL
jgi:hypothetical protein